MKGHQLFTHNKYFHSKGLTQIDCKGKMKGGIGWSLRTSGVDRDMKEFYLMFLSREIDIKLCQNNTKTFVYKVWYKILSFKQSL